MPVESFIHGRQWTACLIFHGQVCNKCQIMNQIDDLLRLLGETVAQWPDEKVTWALRELGMDPTRFSTLNYARGHLALRKRCYDACHRLECFLEATACLTDCHRGEDGTLLDIELPSAQFKASMEEMQEDGTTTGREHDEVVDLLTADRLFPHPEMKLSKDDREGYRILIARARVREAMRAIEAFLDGTLQPPNSFLDALASPEAYHHPEFAMPELE